MPAATLPHIGATEGHRLPPLALPLAGGGRLDLRAWRARFNVVVAVLPEVADPATSAALAALQSYQVGFAEEHARSVAIVGGPLDVATALCDQLGLTFSVAADATNATLDLLTPVTDRERQPVVLLADRYGEIRRREVGWLALSPSGIAEWRGWLTYIDCLCSC